MTDAREYMQVLHDVRSGNEAQLYLKDKRNNTLWVEHHVNIEIGCSAKSLLKPTAKPPCMFMQVEQGDIEKVKVTQ